MMIRRLVLQWLIVLPWIIMRILSALTNLDLSDSEIIASTKDGFATAIMKLIKDQATPCLVI
jgi:hypothetical protein